MLSAFIAYLLRTSFQRPSPWEPSKASLNVVVVPYQSVVVRMSGPFCIPLRKGMFCRPTSRTTAALLFAEGNVGKGTGAPLGNVSSQTTVVLPGGAYPVKQARCSPGTWSCHSIMAERYFPAGGSGGSGNSGAICRYRSPA